MPSISLNCFHVRQFSFDVSDCVRGLPETSKWIYTSDVSESYTVPSLPESGFSQGFFSILSPDGVLFPCHCFLGFWLA